MSKFRSLSFVLIAVALSGCFQKPRKQIMVFDPGPMNPKQMDLAEKQCRYEGYKATVMVEHAIIARLEREHLFEACLEAKGATFKGMRDAAEGE